MPSGDVDLHELAEAVRVRIAQECDYLRDCGAVVENTDDVETLRKGMGAGRRAFRVSYTSEAMKVEPGFSRVIIYGFNLNVTLLYRRMGGVSSRLEDESGGGVTRIAKDAIIALEGQRLGLLNHLGLHCGAVSLLGDPGDSIQALRFTVTGKSRESRS